MELWPRYLADAWLELVSKRQCRRRSSRRANLFRLLMLDITIKRELSRVENISISKIDAGEEVLFQTFFRLGGRFDKVFVDSAIKLIICCGLHPFFESLPKFEITIGKYQPFQPFVLTSCRQTARGTWTERDG